MRLIPVLTIILVAHIAPAQTPDTTHHGGATVSGSVYDSIVHAPLAGAAVQLVAADAQVRFGRTAIADSLGSFALVDIPDGRYMLGFFHPMLDSLGVAPPLRELQVSGHQDVHADLAIPSAAQLSAAICGQRASTSGGALGVGFVRDARQGAAAAGVSVIGEWLEVSLGREGIAGRRPHLIATTGENGWFAMCNLPTGGDMTLFASRGADSSDRLEIHVPADGFLRQDLYLGAARTIVVGDTASRADNLKIAPRRVHVGEGRLTGSVVTATGRQPLADAQVGIVDGPQTRANERGEWILADAPSGTRMLEVRAVGYYPLRKAVHVVAGAAPIHVALSTLKAVLDTVKVTANRMRFNRGIGFQQRHRSGVGRYITATDIARRGIIHTSDVFRQVNGVVTESDPNTFQKRILLRNAFGLCDPAIYLDGSHIRGITSDDIDSWASPEDILGIEVYSEGQAPAEYQEAMTGCGSILIWTK